MGVVMYDLDWLEGFYSRVGTDRGRAVVVVVTELRAAREVVEAARKANSAVDLIGTTEYSKGCLSDLGQALADHDRAVAS
jgi:dipeptidase